MEQELEEGRSSRPLASPLSKVAPAALLGGLIIAGLALRLQGLDWDAGHLFHPDERAILMKVVGDISLPLPVDWGKLLTVSSPLNPHWFNYGTFPLYLLKLVGHLASLVTAKDYGLQDLSLIGRALSAVFDVGTILLVALIGRKLYTWATGLLAAAFVAFSVLHVQLSHFFAVDVILTFFIVLAVYFCIDLARLGSLRSAGLAGLAIGLALATKVSVIPLFATPAVAVLLYALTEEHGSSLIWSPSTVRLNRAVLCLLVVGVVAAVTFFLAEPYAVIDNRTFVDNFVEQSEMVRRVRDYPYTRQYVNTPAFIYPIQQLATWGLGLPLGIVAWGGLAFGLFVASWRRRRAEILLLSWVVPYFLITGSFQVKFLRYLLPIVPFLAIIGAEMLLAARRAGSRSAANGRTRLRAALPRLVEVLTALVVLSSLFYTLAYVHLYAKPHPAVAMSEWINENVPKGSRIAHEHWEEGIPNLDGYSSGELPLYDNDDAKKLDTMIQQLQTADYIVFYSNRLYGTIPRLPGRYPITTRYYKLLFGAELGFRLAHYTTSYPNLLGISFVDDTFSRPGLPVPPELAGYKPTPFVLNGGYADESFTVYDHPKVLLFQKVGKLSDDQLRALLGPVPQPPSQTGAAQRTGLLLSPSDHQADEAGGTWSQIFDRNGITNRLPMLSWLLMVELIALIALPLGLTVCAALPDRGYLLVKSIGILLVVYLTWLMVNLRLFTFSRTAILVAILLVALASAITLWWQGKRLVAFLRENWRLLAIGEALFLAAFLAFYVIRLFNPDLWHPWRGGEKPMDFAYLNAVVKTTYFPPYDPWFAGGYLNYYYFGQTIVATLIRLSGIVPAISYNLAVPLLYALTVANCFSLGYNLLAKRRRQPSAIGHQPSASRVPRSFLGRTAGTTKSFLEGLGNSGVLSQSAEADFVPVGAVSTAGHPLARRLSRVLQWPAIAGGALAALFVTTMGNLDGLYQIVEGLWKVNTLNLQSNIPGLAGLANALDGVWEAVVNQRSLPAFDYWRSSRMMPPTFNITEFPFFTFLFADLHAHLIALPFTVLALGLALAVVLGARGRGSGPPVPWPLTPILVLVMLTLTLGALRVIHTWDFPTYLALGAAALAIGELAKRRRFSLGFFFWTGVKVAIVYFLSTLLFRPFSDSYQLFYSGVQANQERTPLHQYLSIYGLPLFLAGSFLVYRLYQAYRQSLPVRLGRVFLCRWDSLPRFVHLWRQSFRRRSKAEAWALFSIEGGLLIVVGLAAVTAFASPLVAFLLLAIGLVAFVLIREVVQQGTDMPRQVFVLLIPGLAFCLALGVEFVTIQGDIGRMNTVFRFYLQAWVLLGIFGAYALVRLASGARDQVPGGGHFPLPEGEGQGEGDLPLLLGEGQSEGESPKRTAAHPQTLDPRPLVSWRRAWISALVVLLVACAIYPLAATRVRVADRFVELPPTNDGMAYMRSAIYQDEKGPIDLPSDYEAIIWLQDNVQGSPTIVEGVTPLYRWGSRVSVYTGLPTVIGWDWHQKQQRWGYQWMVDARIADVNQIFSTTDQATTLELLHKYGVSYVYIGDLERLYYPATGIAKFDQMVGSSLDLVYSNPHVKIYRTRG